MSDTPRTNRPVASGLGFTGATFLLLLGLKLTHTADLPWWLVFLPLIATAILAVVVVLAVVVFVVLVENDQSAQ